MLETAGQPIWVVDPDGVIRFANPAAIAALGYDRADELFGRDSHETIHYQRPDGTPISRCGVPDAAAAGHGRDGHERSGLVLPARRLDVPRLLRLGADRAARRAAAPSWPSPTSRTACAPSGCCASTTRSSQRATGGAAADRGARGRRGGVAGGVRRHRARGGPGAGHGAGGDLAQRTRRPRDRRRRLGRSTASVPGGHHLAGGGAHGRRTAPGDRPPREDRGLRRNRRA